MRHEVFVLAVLEAEHDAVCRHGHACKHYGYVRYEGVETEKLEYAPYCHGHDEQFERGDGIDKFIAHHVAHGNRGKCGANKE